MRVVRSATNRRQRLGQLVGRLFVNIVATLVAGIAILLLVLSAHDQGSQPAPWEVTTTSSEP
ncbi:MULTISPECIES: hypothetical protein [unclassified Mesorhizobium]|uniref:hypothetical protein n=1 Tax=unclassified Mesorhizobium TaxID=325217 RepID=UPI000FD8A6FC|nr:MULTISPECIES: hypothetical protein [unclassified Mesorhizobium]TGQ46630.1 hypothetical protein EN859_002885 [Mesorhizobium sp. M00.F.Ca.ET.216.01.1.1]TIS55582.1 MAG: hypothetical protein E5W91_22115 [Mesorhizobium sp.]TIS87878.1 MAG: hypothetical protein E5W89_23150 [Mesorhizobium sp.]TJW06454.1 MAG: hypothetical protein E5W82_27910 [Mesorhizobium sp.]